MSEVLDRATLDAFRLLAAVHPTAWGESDARCFWCDDWSHRDCTICEDARYIGTARSYGYVQRHADHCAWRRARRVLGLPIDVCEQGHDDAGGETRDRLHGPWKKGGPGLGLGVLNGIIKDTYGPALRASLDEQMGLHPVMRGRSS